jgi:pimeloyl-ACP methyl ester carboxylesterase
LSGLSADADVELLNSSGSVIFRSTNSGNTAETITRQLGAGTYYTRVYSFNGTNNTNYNLSFSSVSLSSQIRSGSENVNLWLYGSNGRDTTNYINPNRDTIVVIHGWNNSDQNRWVENKWIESPGINRLAREAAEFGQQVLALDWGGIAADPNDLDSWFGDAVPDETAQWITPVAKWASGLLSNLGIASNQLTLIGHSLGTYVASEIGRIGGQVRNLVALDPADNANPFTNYDLDRNIPGTQNPVRFDSVAQYALSFVVSDDAAHVAGDNYRAATAHDSFLVKNWTGWRLTTAIDTHGGVVDIFRNALDRRFLNLNNLSSSRPSLVRNWYDNKGDVDNILDRRNNRGLHEGAINARWTGSDWRIDGLHRVVRTRTDWLGNEYGIEEWTWT